MATHSSILAQKIPWTEAPEIPKSGIQLSDFTFIFKHGKHSELNFLLHLAYLKLIINYLVFQCQHSFSRLNRRIFTMILTHFLLRLGVIESQSPSTFYLIHALMQGIHGKIKDIANLLGAKFTCELQIYFTYVKLYLMSFHYQHFSLH